VLFSAWVHRGPPGPDLLVCHLEGGLTRGPAGLDPSLRCGPANGVEFLRPAVRAARRRFATWRRVPARRSHSGLRAASHRSARGRRSRVGRFGQALKAAAKTVHGLQMRALTTLQHPQSADGQRSREHQDYQVDQCCFSSRLGAPVSRTFQRLHWEWPRTKPTGAGMDCSREPTLRTSRAYQIVPPGRRQAPSECEEIFPTVRRSWAC